MKLKSFALSLMVASSQLLLGVYQTQLKAGECYRTVTKYPLDAFCKDNCTDGSGSCFSSYQKKYSDSVQIMSCLPYQPSGFINCEPGKEEVVGTKWKCSTEVNTKGLVLCITAAAGTGLAIYAAAIAAGGTVVLLGMTEAQLLGLGGGALTGIASYLGCDYCSTHNCVVNRFDPGEDLKEVVSVKIKGQCPIPKG